MKISNRLKTIASFVDDDSYIIDVGCDHALLDIYLVKTKLNIKAIASDVNEKPLQVAFANIKKYGLDNEIKVSLSDGISDIVDDVDTIIISGMGTNNIIDILFKDKNKLNSIKSIIISSNNDYYLLRKTFIDNGYYIKDEEIVFENDKYYPIIRFEKGIKKYNNFQLEYGPILINKKTDIFKEYVKKNINKLKVLNKRIPFKYFGKKITIKKEIRKLQKI